MTINRYQPKIDHHPTAQDILDKALSFLGPENISALYNYLHAEGIERNEIFNEPEGFANALRSFFGTAVKIFEKQIIRQLLIVEECDITMNLVEIMQKLRNIEMRVSGRTIYY